MIIRSLPYLRSPRCRRALRPAKGDQLLRGPQAAWSRQFQLARLHPRPPSRQHLLGRKVVLMREAARSHQHLHEAARCSRAPGCGPYARLLRVHHPRSRLPSSAPATTLADAQARGRHSQRRLRAHLCRDHLRLQEAVIHTRGRLEMPRAPLWRQHPLGRNNAEQLRSTAASGASPANGCVSSARLASPSSDMSSAVRR